MVLNPESEPGLVHPEDFPAALAIQREVSPFVSGFVIVETNGSTSFDLLAYNRDVVNYYKRLQEVIQTYDPSEVEKWTQIKAGSIPTAIDFSHCSFNAHAELVRVDSFSSGESSGEFDNLALDTNSTLGIGSLHAATGDYPGHTTASGITHQSTRPRPPARAAHSLAPLQVPVFIGSGESSGGRSSMYNGSSRQTHASGGSGESGGQSRRYNGPYGRGDRREDRRGDGRNNGKRSSWRRSPRRRNVRKSRRKSVRKSRRKSVRKSRRKSVRKSRMKSRR